MHHLAIMHKQFLDKIIAGTKTIESRWYVTKRAPYGKITVGDVIYFKLSGGPVTTKASVQDALFFDLNHTPITELYHKYGRAIGFNDLKEMNEFAKNKNYCTLAFLEDVKPITPFAINKTGYGNANAWIIVKNIKDIRVTSAKK
ncbi:MAG: hypothetical protein WC916_06915 [Candidatus Woesearchaeota archaeon]